MPVYEEQAQALHDRGKLMAVHMDGRLGSLKDLIGATQIDIVEAFHPPPMGDLSIGEALRCWPDKVVWLGFPGSVYALGPVATREFAAALMSEVGTGERLAVEMSTENQVSNKNLLSLTAVLQDAVLPVAQQPKDADSEAGR